jgi:hypothetical protein
MAFALLLGVGGCANAEEKPPVQPDATARQPTCHVYEQTTETWQTTACEVVDEDVLLPMRFLEKPLGLKRLALPDEKVGVCFGDLCVPIPTGSTAGCARTIHAEEYIPMRPLVDGIGGRMIWDAGRREMLLDLSRRPRPTAMTSNDVSALTLLDLAGKPVPLTRFRGKKVLLFAWASW